MADTSMIADPNVRKAVESYTETFERDYDLQAPPRPGEPNQKALFTEAMYGLAPLICNSAGGASISIQAGTGGLSEVVIRIRG